MRLFSIDTGLFKLDGGAMFGTIPKTLWQRTLPADEQNLCALAMRCLLIEDEDRLILIDTGIGEKQTAKFFSYYFLHGDDSLTKSIEATGFSMDDVTDVILTHLHLDHVGGALKMEGENSTPTFKNATYWVNKQHWEWAIHPNDREKPSFLKENILPLQDLNRLKFVDFPEEEICFSKNIRLRLVNGHTEGMMLPLINFEGQTIAFVADLFPTRTHIPVNYIAAYDIQPLLAMNEKRAFLKEALDNNYVLFLEHDPEVECCRVVETEKGIRLGETFSLAFFIEKA